MKKLLITLFIMLGAFIPAACGNSGGANGGMMSPSNGEFFDAMMKPDVDVSGEGYNEITELPFVSTTELSETFFRLDSNKGSYTNLRRYIEKNQKINPNLIKTDELINYFNYDLPDPKEGEDFSITSSIMRTPWNEQTHLITIGVKTKKVELSENINNNLVFLIDISGSMTSTNKLDLIREAFPLMLDGLNPNDTVSIVTYASGVKVHLDGCKVENKEQIVNCIKNLKAGGSTNGAGGLNKAYEVARKHFISGGNNRIILATDGDFNVGPSSNEELKSLVSQQLSSGIYLSVLGFGMGNYQDDMVETLAMHGNGNYAYIDTLIEAKKVLTEDLATTLISVAKDVKVKVEFNPELITEYRVIGYENKQLTEDEFENEEADSGEVGSGHTTVVTYEVKLNPDEAVLQNPKFLDITINYKDPTTDESKTLTDTFYTNEINYSNEDFIFVSCIVEFSLVLRDSSYKANANLQNVLTRLESLQNIQNDVYKLEFIELVKKVMKNNLIQ